MKSATNRKHFHILSGFGGGLILGGWWGGGFIVLVGVVILLGAIWSLYSSE
ncbi:hypothetical protein HY380_00820 [Candidatus Saccharibacteria bacterium]|nr:hypothetical protein [Candidatus Saccharibacteria bacterium]